MNRLSCYLLVLAALALLPWQPASAATSIIGVVRSGGAMLAETPDGAEIQMLGPGLVVTPTARNADSSWIRVVAVGTSGWIAADRVMIVSLTDLPVVSATGDAPAADAAPPGTATVEAPAPEPIGVPDAAEAPEPALPVQPQSAPEESMSGLVTTQDSRLNIRAGAGVNYAVVGKAQPGETLTVTGVSCDGMWLRVARADLPAGNGWVAANYVRLLGDVEQLSVFGDDTPAAPAQMAAEPERPETAGLSGTLVFQTNPGGTIYAYDLTTSALLPLTHGFDPAISPDGTQVAFTRDGGEHGLYVIRTDGGNEHLIFNGRDQLSSPKWSPDGQWILFVRGDERETCILMGGRCVSGSPGGGRTPPGGNGDGGDDNGPLEVQMTLYHLALVDVNGGNYRDVPSLDSARAPDWGVGGIVYQSEAGMQRTRDEPAARSELIITDPLKPYFDDPAQQPGGTVIVYQGKEGSHTELFVVNQDGSNVRSLTRPATALVDVLPSNVAPSWSPDGQYIVFLSNRESDGEAGNWRLWVMQADGGNQHSLPIDVTLDYTFGAEQAVSWGP